MVVRNIVVGLRGAKPKTTLDNVGFRASTQPTSVVLWGSAITRSARDRDEGKKKKSIANFSLL